MTLPRINQQHLLLSIILGVVGLLINCFPIQFFANVQFVLGNTMTVIAAVLLGPWYAFVTAMMASTGLMLVWDSPHVYLFFGLEALFLGYARRHDIYALYADAAYWLLIGAPMVYLYAVLLMDIPPSHLGFIISKQGINGLIYTSLASLLILAIPKLWFLKDKVKDRHRRQLSAQLTYFFTLMVTLTLLFSALIFNFYSLERQQVMLKQNMTEAVVHISTAAQNHIENHKAVIQNTANQLNLMADTPEQWQAILSSLHQSYPSFISMLIADPAANIVNASPLSRLLSIQKQQQSINIKDREYFIESFYNQRFFVSSAFLGRGFGNDAIIAMSAPFYLDEQHTKIAGIIEGSFDLSHFSYIDQVNKYSTDESVVMVDEQNQIIYASEKLAFKPLSQFNFVINKGVYRANLDLINIHNTTSIVPEYIYTHRELNNGWTVYILKEFSPLLKLAEEQMFSSFILLLILLVCTFYISTKLSTLLTVPLEAVANQFSQPDTGKASTIDENSPKEVFSLYQRLVTSKQQLVAHQLELEQTVANRTAELEKANIKLTELVDRDPLTGLYNRRYAERKFGELLDFCLRSEQAITVVLLDLDLFKRVNDNYGHLAGDECLRNVSQLMQTYFKRDIDIVARYGGEEFLLILPLSNALHIEQHLNGFREALSQLNITSPEDKQSFKVTVSIGAITANADYNVQLDKWIKVADDNLYQAKQQGRNRTIINIISD
ncbi:diguanylate cyclase [Shewanella sp. Actino-trap-3]|uniref:diguanylate cyclase n=1 Tax=Shewanella sp. Actino-trap-3 TaxID=2058331 RepID=UPI001E2CCBE6|nr:diguanylate cyclase [Shewanella sp. Actino-trap-3]